MSQVSILAIDVAQGVDSIGGTGNKPSTGQGSSSDFSQVMSQQQKDKSGNTGRNTGESDGKKTPVVERSAEIKSENQQTIDNTKAENQRNNGSDSDSQQQGLHQGGEQTAEQPEQTETAQQLELLTQAIDQQGNEKVSDIAQQLLAFIQASDEVNTETTEVLRTFDEQMLVSELVVSLNGKEQSAAGDAVATNSNELLTDTEASDAENSDPENGAKQQQTTEAKQFAQQSATSDNNSKNTSDTANKDVVKVNTEQGEETVEQSVAVKPEVQVAKSEKAVTTTNTQQTPPVIRPETDSAQSVERDKELLMSGMGVTEKNTLDNPSDDKQSAIKVTTAADKVMQAANVQGQAIEQASEASVKNSAEDVTEQQVTNTVAATLDNANTERKTSAPASQRIINQASVTSEATAQQSSQQQGASEQSDQQTQQQNSELVTEQLANGSKVHTNNDANANTMANTTSGNETTTNRLGQQSLMQGEEHMFQHTMAKEHADSMSVQSAKTAVQIQNETISIYRKDFTTAVKDKVMVMINQKIKQLDIRLDPPELGSMQVRLNLQNEQAAVNIVVQNQQAKEALEQNLHKLKDMLADSGVDVGDANIEQRQQQSEAQNGFAGQQGFSGGDGTEGNFIDETSVGSQVNLYKASATGVDYYA